MNIAFVAGELFGLTHNGGIGTATRYISEHLARLPEHEIHVYCVGEPRNDPEAYRHAMESLNVHVHCICDTANVFYPSERLAYHVFSELRDTAHDVYIFHEHEKAGFFCFLAKESGVAFRSAKLGLILHGSSRWCDEANRVFPSSLARYSCYDMEQTCVELSDFVISPSEYMLRWAAEEGWKLPADSRCIYNLVSPPGSFTPSCQTRKLAASDIRELVFFGRREDRKGIRVFCDAINLLPDELLADRTVTFLGSGSRYSCNDVLDMLREKLHDSQFNVRFIADKTPIQAREYLCCPGRLAVMPSLLDNSPCVICECLESGIPFLASSSGGGSELICEEDRGDVIFIPEKWALSGRLADALANGVPISRPSYSHELLVGQWRKFFEELAARPSAAERVGRTGGIAPLVSLVLVHHDRPNLLKLSLESCLRQDYEALEIIVVDDGSTAPEAIAYLDDLEKKRVEHPNLRILRQKNRYLGAARNTGTQAANGEYVVFFDDDNVALPDMVSRFVAAAQYSGADAVSGGARFFREQDGAPPLHPTQENMLMLFWGGHQRYSSMMYNHLGDAAGMYRREMLLKTGGFHEQMGVGHEDWKMYADILRLGGRIATVPEMMYWYRVTPGSMLGSTDRYRNAVMHLTPYMEQLPPHLAHLPFVVYSLMERIRTDAGARQASAGAAFLRRCGQISPVSDILRKMGYACPIIYGYGRRGQALSRVLADSGIEVVATVDRKNNAFSSLEQIPPDTKADVLIVSIFGGRTIADELRSTTSLPIFTLEELLDGRLQAVQPDMMKDAVVQQGTKGKER